jgi:ribosome biogenesis GTPase A
LLRSSVATDQLTREAGSLQMMLVYVRCTKVYNAHSLAFYELSCEHLFLQKETQMDGFTLKETLHAAKRRRSKLIKRKKENNFCKILL